MTIRDMVARHSNFDETRDFIPTPPYATRALFEYAMPDWKQGEGMTAWDPAAGHGHMTRTFEEYGYKSIGTDIKGSPEHSVTEHDFVASGPHPDADLIVTNPPYALLEGFIREGLDRAKWGFALLTRVQALETQTRYRDVFSKTPPTQIAFFSDRIPFKTGAVVRKAPKMFFHAWLCWDVAALRARAHRPRPPMWIPPNAQKLLETDEDYK
jgi:hypothetical protein